MQFKMDSQSFQDLDIFARANGGKSIYELFKNTRTLGGRARVEEMMRNPCTDLALLTDRNRSIQYLSERELEIDITHNQLDLINHYLKYSKGILKHNPIDSLAAYLGNKLRSNIHYYTIGLGLENLIPLLKHALVLSEQLNQPNAPDYLQKLSETIKTTLGIETVQYAIAIHNYKKLNFHQTSKLDSFFRGKGKFVIQEMLNIFYELDALGAIASTAKQKGFCFPEYVNSATPCFEVKGLYHPGISKAIGNDLSIDQNNNLIFLSGSNMAGKSSLLKSIGLAVYLAHIGFPVPAASMKTGIFNGLITSINLADNTQSGLSHYYSEVIRIKETANLLLEQEKMFIMFDELFRGTNVKDAHQASYQVISELARINTSIFIISTHIVELATELQTIPNIAFKYMETNFIDGKPTFSYQLQNGVSTDRLGMYILNNEGVIDIIKKVAQVRTEA